MIKLLQICVEGNVGSTGTIAERIGIMAIEKGWESHIAFGRFPRPSKSQTFQIESDLVLFVIREKEYSNRFNLKKFFYFLPIFIASVYFTTFYFIDNYDTIQRKFVAYVIERAISESDTIAMFQISSFSDFYKLPFSFIFALLQPINLTSKILSVSGFVGVINFFGIFLACGNILAFFDKKIRGLNFTWIINALFIITLITSLGVSRHYYFMLPFYVIFLSAYITKKNNFIKTLFSSVALTLLISVFYLFRIS